MRIGNIILGLAVMMAPSAGQAGFESRNGIAAIANGTVITMQDVEMASAQGVEVARRTSPTAEVFYQKRVEAMRDALDLLVERQLILSDFKSAGVNVPEKFIDDAVSERIRQKFGDRINLAKTLKAEGITPDAFRQRVKEEIILEYMNGKNVREASLISPAKIERYYQTNLHKYKLGDRVKLRVILLKGSVGMAQEIQAQIDGGAPFAEMASIYSQGSAQKEGGLWGWYEESQLRKGLSEIAFNLQSNQVSGVVGFARAADETYWVYQYNRSGAVTTARHFTDGEAFLNEKTFKGGAGSGDLPVAPQEFYLMKIEDKQIAHTRSIVEVRDEIEKELIIEDRKRLKKQWIQRLRAKSLVTYF